MPDEHERRCDQPLHGWQNLPNPKRCPRPAGEGTTHPGYGPCIHHRGNSGPVQAAWRKAMNIASELDVSPWESLLTEVKISSGRIAWIDQKLVEAVEADEERKTLASVVDPESPASIGLGPGVKELLVESRAERRHRSVVAKAAIDAGVAERLVRSIENEGALVAAAIIAGLDALVLTTEQRTAALSAAHSKLLAIEAVPGGPKVINGEIGP